MKYQLLDDIYSILVSYVFLYIYGILSSVFGFISTILIVYIAFKIISAIIQACLATKAVKITQVHEPTHVIAQTLEKELALLKASLASNIFPKLPTENTYIDSTFNSSI